MLPASTMPKRRIIFIPWENSAEFIEKSQQWNRAATRGNKNYEIINYRPAESNHPTLVNLPANSSIYIRGHGQPGGDTITADGNPLPITDACQRLIDMGLKSTYQGVIKFFNCYSALRGRDGKKPTAEQGAEYFRSQGFNQCQFHGYMGPLRSEYEAIRWSGWWSFWNWIDSYDHKQVAIQEEIQGYPGYWASPKGDPKIRASQGRRPF